jgi:hypothetical protein
MSEGEAAIMQADGRRENPWAWTALAAILVFYVFSALRVGPISNFGIQDGALYFSSAKALATGQGYILPSFPVTLKATKYPELYPLLLAGVWKLDPHFPGNVILAVALTLALGCMALLFAFLLLRRWPGLGDWQALAIVGLCAFTGYFLDLSASVMTDIPFMAAMLGAIWLAQCSTDTRAGTPATQRWRGWAAFGAGLLAGCSVGFRSLGLATVAGIGLVYLVRRDYRKAFWFSVAAAPVVLVSLWPALVALVHSSGPQSVTNPNTNGWTQTLCYYSSYACNWRMNVQNTKALRAVVLTNLKRVVEQPGLYLLYPLAVGAGLRSLVLVTLLSVGAYAGVVRYVRRTGWQILPVVFLFYLLAVVPWPYTPDRFLLPFLPLFFGGLWVEGRHFVALVTEHLRPSHSFAERTVGGVLTLGVVALAATVAVNYGWVIPSGISASASANRRALTAESEAYEWIRNHAAPNSSIIAYRDGLAYLYTGHHAIPPILCQTQAFYLKDPHYAQQDAAHLADVARHIHASYWLTSQVDFMLAGKTDHAILERQQRHLLAGAPLVFQSADGTVRLYDVQCLDESGTSNCSEQAAQGNNASSAQYSQPPR